MYDFGRPASMTDIEWLALNRRERLNEFLQQIIKNMDTGTVEDIEFVHMYKNMVIIKKRSPKIQ